ncbi:MAG: hypothetical protein ACI9LY_003458 [Arenicella sp.]|jgi:hypothetical protein
MMEAGFLLLSTADSLFEKVKHDYGVLQSNQLDPYSAFNFFVTAEHLPEWVGRRTLKYSNPYLRICSHLATGAKHYIVTQKYKTQVQSTTVDIYVEEGYVEGDYFEEVLTIQLSEEEAENIGAASIPILELADKIIEFWEAYFEAQHS